MMNITRLTILATTIFFLSKIAVFSQTQNEIDCSFLKDCKLVLKGQGSESIVMIKGDKHVELADEGKSCVKSDLEWLNDCEYKASITYFKWPGFMFEVGEVLHAKVARIIEDSVYMNVKVQDLEFEVMYLRIE